MWNALHKATNKPLGIGKTTIRQEAERETTRLRGTMAPAVSAFANRRPLDYEGGDLPSHATVS